MIRSTAALCLFVSMASAGVARADTPDKEAAARFEIAVKLAKRGDYAGALAEFEAAYARAPHPDALLNIGVMQKRLLRYDDALRSFEKYLELTAGQPKHPRRQEVERERQEILSLVGHVTVDVAEPAGALIRLDGAELGDAPLHREVAVAPGRHRIDVSAKYHTPEERTVDIVSGQKLTVEVRLAPSAKEAPTTLAITTIPPNARIAIDGRSVGRSPWTGPVESGGHRVRVSLDNHAPAEQEVLVQSGQTRSLSLLLTAQEASRPIYKRWYFWGGVSAVVVAGTVTALLIANRDDGLDGELYAR